MAELGIGEVARRAGLASSAIRYYERAGLVPPARRRNGRRVYDEHILRRLALVERAKRAKRAGFTLAETRRLLSGFSARTPPGPRWRSMATQKLRELDQRIAEARRMQRLLRSVTTCECPSFDDCARLLRG